jgi:hypothetical protein
VNVGREAGRTSERVQVLGLQRERRTKQQSVGKNRGTTGIMRGA